MVSHGSNSSYKWPKLSRISTHHDPLRRQGSGPISWEGRSIPWIPMDSSLFGASGSSQLRKFSKSWDHHVAEGPVTPESLSQIEVPWDHQKPPGWDPIAKQRHPENVWTMRPPNPLTVAKLDPQKGVLGVFSAKIWFFLSRKITSWWFQPIWKILVKLMSKMEHFPK